MQNRASEGFAEWGAIVLSSGANRSSTAGAGALPCQENCAMDFNFNPEDEAFRMEFREWLNANKQFAPNTGETAGGMAEGRGAFEQQQAWAKKMAEGRWLAPSWPEKYGGRGAGILQNIVYGEELSRAGVAAPMIGMGISLFGPTLLHWGTEEQKQRFIPPIMKAEEIWCQGYSEPGSGSDLASLQTRAVEDGDYFVVNGQKVWTSIAQHADWIFLLVRTDPDAPKHKGISYLMVDMHSPGVTVRPLVQITGNKGFNEVFFEDVRVPKKNLVGEKNQGWQVAITTLMFERSGGGGDRGGVGRRQRAAENRRVCLRGGRSALHGISAAHAAAQGDAARAGRLDDEALRHRAQPANPVVRDGTAGAV